MISKNSSYLLVILFLTCAGNAAGQVAKVKSEQQQQGLCHILKPITAVAGEPEPPLGIYKQLRVETEEDYQKKVAERAAKDATFVPIKRKPTGLGPAARFGSGFPFEGHNCSWALDGDEQKGYVLYVDLNANGDLGDDQPLRENALSKSSDESSCMKSGNLGDEVSHRICSDRLGFKSSAIWAGFNESC
jgi:hypothetical protein